MKRIISVMFVLLLGACGGSGVEQPAPKISRAQDYTPQGMTYDEFRKRGVRDGDNSSLAAQKRFLTLDRDHNGRLSDAELGGL